jgi:Uma2 family endonuclease
MEILSPLKRHGNRSYLLGRMVDIIDIIVEEFDLPLFPADPITLKRPDLAKGVEPDKLYYFGQDVSRVLGPREFDLTLDPPPNLIIEVDHTSSSVPRLPIFAALGIPEVWRMKGETLFFLQLQADRTYLASPRSRAFPTFTLVEATRFLDQGQHVDVTPWLRSFRAFVRDVLVPRRVEAEGGP